jgi:hypothetical protein
MRRIRRYRFGRPRAARNKQVEVFIPQGKECLLSLQLKYILGRRVTKIESLEIEAG